MRRLAQPTSWLIELHSPGRRAEAFRRRGPVCEWLRAAETASQDGLGGDALVDMERDHVHLEGGMLGLAGPVQLRVQVRDRRCRPAPDARGLHTWAPCPQAGCSPAWPRHGGSHLPAWSRLAVSFVVAWSALSLILVSGKYSSYLSAGLYLLPVVSQAGEPSAYPPSVGADGLNLQQPDGPWKTFSFHVGTGFKARAAPLHCWRLKDRLFAQDGRRFYLGRVSPGKTVPQECGSPARRYRESCPYRAAFPSRPQPHCPRGAKRSHSPPRLW